MKGAGLAALLLLVSLRASGQRVAVVGGGIAGAATLHYLREMAPQASATLFEASQRLGGRLKHATFHGAVVELGGDAWATSNEYMLALAESAGVRYSNSSYGGNGLTGVWDGLRMRRMDTGLVEEAEFGAAESVFRLALRSNYRKRRQATFDSVRAFLGSMEHYAAETAADWARKWKLTRAFQERTWEPITRTIYDSDLNSINTFAALVAGLPTLETAYSVEGGNSLLVQRLVKLAAPSAVRMNTSVSEIRRVGDSYLVDGEAFDHVVVACPIEKSGINLVNISAQPAARPYHHWYVTVVAAQRLNPAYFGGEDPVPDQVLTTANTTSRFSVMAVLDKCADGSGCVIYKAFSNFDISSRLALMVEGYVDHIVQYWPYTFPDLGASTRGVSFQPAVLDGAAGVINLASIESVTVAMESGAIAGRNAALLISKNKKNRS